MVTSSRSLSIPDCAVTAYDDAPACAPLPARESPARLVVCVGAIVWAVTKLGSSKQSRCERKQFQMPHPILHPEDLPTASSRLSLGKYELWLRRRTISMGSISDDVTDHVLQRQATENGPIISLGDLIMAAFNLSRLLWLRFVFVLVLIFNRS